MMGLPQEHMQDTAKSNAQEPCLVLQVVPPRANSSRDMAALETVMQGLALDACHPVALEIARIESGRQFLLRATSRAALDHLYAFAMSGEDARMLHELDGIEEEDITNLDDFTCYVKVIAPGSALAGVFAAS